MNQDSSESFIGDMKRHMLSELDKKEIKRRGYMEYQHLTALKEFPYLKNVSRPIYYLQQGS